MTSNKKKVLLFTDWYYPGYKAGGPIQSCRNIVKTMKDSFDFFVFTSDRDLGDAGPYPGVALNTWVRGQNGEAIFYASPEKMTLRFMMNLLRSVSPETVYLNSMFSFRYTILPRLAMKLSRYQGKIVLAPRGMLHEGPMGVKSGKKKVFLRTFRLLKLNKRVLFHATDTTEMNNLHVVFPGSKVLLADNIPNLSDRSVESPAKSIGELKLVYLSRIHPLKNLQFVLDILLKESLDGKIQLDVFGDTEHNTYAKACAEMIGRMPENVSVRLLNSIPNEEVFDTLKQYHAFILPTLGENFGHAIFEALAAGLPVIISDKTPWIALELRKAGWDIPLSRRGAFVQAIAQLLAMNKQEWCQWSAGARARADDFVREAGFNDKYQALFS